MLLSQLLIASATVCSVVLHVSFVVGPPPPSLSVTLASFVRASLTSTSTYLYLAGHAAIFATLVGLLVLIARHLRLTSPQHFRPFLVAAYSLSSAGIAADYSWARPLFNVQGEPDATAFFFTVGLFGMELALEIYVLLFVVCLALLLRIPLDRKRLR